MLQDSPLVLPSAESISGTLSGTSTTVQELLLYTMQDVHSKWDELAKMAASKLQSLHTSVQPYKQMDFAQQYSKVSMRAEPQDRTWIHLIPQKKVFVNM
jgi:hypothetical protein